MFKYNKAIPKNAEEIPKVDIIAILMILLYFFNNKYAAIVARIPVIAETEIELKIDWITGNLLFSSFEKRLIKPLRSNFKVIKLKKQEAIPIITKEYSKTR